MEKRKSTGLLLSVLGVISLVLITAGVTYAFFSYTKEGTKTNTITTGAITFRYDEVSGNGLSVTDALPMSDDNGKTQTATNKFSFSIESTTPSSAEIPYVVTLRNVTDSAKTLPTDQVKVWLNTSVNGTNNTENGTAVRAFSALPGVDGVSQDNASWFTSQFASSVGAANDKIIFEGKVPAGANVTGQNAYTFDLGMWLLLADGGSGMTDYSAYEFVKTGGTTTTTIDDTNGTLVSTLETNHEILTSTEFYRRSNLASDNAEYINAAEWSRIKYRNYTAGKVITANTSLTAAPTGFENANEQYYPLSTKEFSVRVNVYAEGSVYTAPAQNNG